MLTAEVAGRHRATAASCATRTVPVTAIVEQKDASEAQRAITEINSGVFAFDAKLLAEALSKVTTDNAQGEEYLTDILAILRQAGHRVGASAAGDHREIAGDQQPGAVGARRAGC